MSFNEILKYPYDFSKYFERYQKQNKLYFFVIRFVSFLSDFVWLLSEGQTMFL